MWNMFEYIFGFFNTDGTSMMPNSGMDVEGKAFGQSNDDNSSMFATDWGNDTHGGGIGSDF